MSILSEISAGEVLVAILSTAAVAGVIYFAQEHVIEFASAKQEAASAKQEAASAKQEAASAKQEAADTDKKLIGACADGLAKIYEQGKKEGYEAGVIFGKSNPRGL
jgi:flagellar biosynthesis/type III secretory pathway protein FliH